MTSTIPVEIIDDDDGFDWEAAVREIDVACQATKPSTSRPVEFSHSVPADPIPCSKNNKRPLTSRQPTLDNFVGRAGLRPFTENRAVRDSGQDEIEGDERACCIDIDSEAAKTWIYPVNVPLRDYQLSITKTALFSNTLVALPTGLGKTLIAAVVMYNYFRWFPEGKIVFAAPSRPLVMQQIEACHNIVGIPQEWTIDMTGQISPTRRACFWKAKRVFFVTPQVLEKDIQSGTCMVKYLVCLVIDEAHRALGNYSYCVAVRELMAVPVQLRILALTATPGSKQQTIQLIIDNLHISTLEYRNESHHDVSPYVHNRKIELLEVAMGQDAVEVNNLLLEVIRPFAARLCAVGVLQNRDFQTLSPCDLLNSRDRFRQAPPPDLPHMKYGEVEGYFGVLITLYHIRKLLSSHGIRPAYEMLQEKLQQGSFARLMSRNEVIQKAKLLMQRSLSHGAPNPKLSKMLEVLIDHFKTNDPQRSRVIIFSNFRGSVRDIMDALGKVGEYIKPTEFIGQSSGKALKGQSQKVQQAVLEKFRAGGYNVIVATSIGEEGLDIMEVDLVICFDANISPLRMIQRMGRTGRKHDGKVVVLACEGSELKGYMRKQANSKAVGKHMRNGGMNSFNFHSSPRMIPHIFKPEVQFVELSIEQFVPRGRKVKDDHPSQTLMFRNKLTDAETELISQYFHPNIENTWRPSLIAFPHFQAFPSRVHKVMHSFKTGMLIDMMQHLQELSFSRESKTLFAEDEASSGQYLGVEIIEQREDSPSLYDSPKALLERNVSDFEVSPTGISKTKEKHNMPDLRGQSSSAHSYLFGSDYVSVDALGMVLILSVPQLPSKEVSHSKCTSASSTLLPNCFKQDSCHFSILPGDYKELSLQEKSVANLTNSTQTICTKNENVLISRLCNSDVWREKTVDGIEKIPETQNLKNSLSNEGDSMAGTSVVVENKTPILLADDFSNDFRDAELSPRLTNLIKSGVVPESPIHDSGLSNGEGKNKYLVPDLVLPAKFPTELLLKSSSPRRNEINITDIGACGRGASASPINDKTHTPVVKTNNSANARECVSTSPIVEGINTPLANLTNNSSSKDWRLSSGDNSESVEKARKFKRLRRYGDSCKRKIMKSTKENSVVPIENLSRTFARTSSIPNKSSRGKKKPIDDGRAFIEEEAEVSSEASVSDDEEDEEDNDSYDDSFIDDKINPTAANTQAEGGGIDIMAIYRRSLLSQSPMGWQPDNCTNISPLSVAPITRITGTGSSPGKTTYSLQTPQSESENQCAGRNSLSYQLNPERISSEAMPCTKLLSPIENERMESRKRKLSFYQVGSVPAINLEREFSFQSEATGNESSMQGQAKKIEANGDVFYDDQFYEGLDLDAVEAQATMLLRYKSESSIQRPEIIPEPARQNLCLLGSPSFDLGI
ncbi:hypothetical protein L1049_025584 [Liquidambar formosana]|uniref:Uncharacterized protein n=1 Tax=Liquidambar formosana TaxID=63359 RepID=A0AAP0ND38_LIQFO